jgi:hypothetical protein
VYRLAIRGNQPGYEIEYPMAIVILGGRGSSSMYQQRGFRADRLAEGGRRWSAPGRFQPSEPIVGDRLRHPVVFPWKADSSSLAGKPVCLRFHLRDAELYAFAFRDRP